MQKKKQASFIKGFSFAGQGIKWNLMNERNMRCHFLLMLTAIIFGMLLKISMGEWLILLTFFALIPALELVNSAIESTCDVIRDELKLDYQATKLPRDLAAGAVLWASIIALLAGIIIFVPKIVYLLFHFFVYFRIY